ncbi:MAG TPA: hypothetical protein VFJ72_03985 [Rubrobacteraceae bacterium]|nr:hypothetical protein [Rubrobacteraceae bacterium]
MSDSVRTPRGTRVTPEDTTSSTYRAETSHREMMEQDLMDLGVWLIDHPDAARKNLKAIRSARVLKPGVYYNLGTGMVDRLYSSQRVALGHKMFRISSDPAAPVEEIRRKVLEGKG